jgi:hypothetical protein
MKVIEPGRKQIGWSRECKCTGNGNGGGGCGAVLLVEQPDLYRTTSSHYDGSTDHYVTFTCSECGVQTDISHVPGNIKDALPTRAAWLRLGN